MHAALNEVTSSTKRLASFRLSVALTFLLAVSASRAHCQVAPTSIHGDETIFFGATASGERISYGLRTLYGPRIFLDAALTLRWGIEASASWANVHQRDDVHQSTYMAGPRLTFAHAGRFTFAGKALAGGAVFHYPFDFAQGSYLVVAPGVDINFKCNRRIRWQVLDAEYTYLPQFTYGAMRELTLATGLRIRLY